MQHKNIMTVELNVGGKHFEISRSVLSEHPGLVLNRLVSEASLKQPIFIDRNGDVFSLVLDYLRYGNIVLPVTVPFETFVEELAYYGVVHQEGSIVRNSLEDLPSIMAAHQQQLETLRRQTESLTLAAKMESLANYCARRYIEEYKKGIMILPFYILLDAKTPEHRELFAVAKELNDPSKFDMIQNCLLKHRLELQKPKPEDVKADRLLLRLWTQRQQ